MTFSHVAALIAFIAAANSSPLDARASTPISSITTAQWNSLNQTVGGRLYQGAPIAKPCFTFYNGAQSNPDLAQCKAVQDGYVDEVSIANNYGGFVNVCISQHSWHHSLTVTDELGNMSSQSSRLRPQLQSAFGSDLLRSSKELLPRFRPDLLHRCPSGIRRASCSALRRLDWRSASDQEQWS